jgi:hypothetical protein
MYIATKFNCQADEDLYEISLDGGLNEECGSVTEYGTWYGMMRTYDEYAGVILIEDSQGFVDVMRFDTDKQLDFYWQGIVADVAKWYENTEEE